MEWNKDLDKAMDALSTKGAFLTFNSKKKNTMTVSWGFIGYAWHRPLFICMVRSERFSHQLMKESDSFTISIPEKGKLAEELKICGTKSGRDFDKTTVVDFLSSENGYVISGAKYYYECKIKYIDELKEEAFEKDIILDSYPKKDFHSLCIGEIVKVYQK